MKTIDQQTHQDIVDLIDAEMGEVACGNYNNNAEQLACVIEGRMGYETPKKPVLPSITPGEWTCYNNPLTTDWAIYSEDNTMVVPCVESRANAKLIAAGPDLAEALYKVRKVLISGELRTYSGLKELMTTALRKAGADI